MTLIIGTGRKLAWVGERASVSTVLDEDFEPAMVVPKLTAGPAALAEIGLATPAQVREVERSLSDADIAFDARDSGQESKALPLSALIAQLRARELRPEGVLATAGASALWIDSGASLSEATEMARLFVCGMASAALRAVYGACWQGSELVAVEDRCPWRELEDSPELRRLTRTGSVALTADEQLSVRVFGRWQSRSGVLSPIAGETSESIQIGAASLVVAASRYVVPSLPADPFATERRKYDFAVGCAVSRAGAEKRAKSELAERFALSADWLVPITKRPARALEGRLIHPDQLYRCSEKQRERQGLARFDEAADEEWVRCRSLAAASDSVWVPAALVSGARRPSWLPPGALNSSGSAAHTSRAAATDAAWRELVERDAFLRMWLSKISAPQVPKSHLPTKARELLEGVRNRSGVEEAALLQLRGAEEMAVMVAVAIGPQIGVCIGSAAGAPARAAGKAMVECALAVLHPPSPVDDAVGVTSPLDHAGYYRDPDRIEESRWLFEGQGREEATPSVPSVERGEAVAVLQSSQSFPRHVVARVVCPDLIPMWFGYDQEPSALPDLLALSAPSEDAGPLPPHPFA